MKPRLRDLDIKVGNGKDLTDSEKEYMAKQVCTYWDSHPDVTNRFPRWKKYIAWTAGYQLFDYNKITKKLVEVPLDRKRKIVFNKIKPFVRTLLSKLNADTQSITVSPNTTDDEDVQAARAGKAVVEGLAEKTNFDEELLDLKLWLIVTNRGYLRVIWDRESKGILGYAQDGNEEGAPAGEPVFEDGDVRVECVSPFNCRVDPLYHKRDKWRWFIYGEEVDAAEIEDAYDLDDGSLSEKSSTLDNAYDLDMQEEESMIVGTPDKDDDITGKTIVFKEMWTKRGYYFVAGDKLVDYGINEDKEIPYFAVEETLIPIDNYEKGFSYNESLIKDMIPIQREYNRQVGMTSLAIERASKLKVLTPLGSMLNKRQWTNDYGVFIDFNPSAGEPHQMKMDPMPVESSQYTSFLEREMESSMNMHESSFGRLPERASHASGTLVNVLLEQDDVVLNSLLTRINKAVAGAWGLALRKIQKNYNTSRLIKFTGEDGMPDIIEFQGADLRGNTDVRVSSQTGLPRNRALRIEYIMRLREGGLLVDDKNTLDMLEFGNAEKIFKDSFIHERRAARENTKILRQEFQTPEDTAGWVYPLEDHSIHMKSHMNFRLSPRFERLSPEQQQAMDVHIQATSMTIQEQIQQQMANNQPPPNEPQSGPRGQPVQAG